MNKITVIGDVHGRHKEYLDIVNKNEFTVQLGDLGFNYWFLRDINPNRHVFISGNHDNYDVLNNEEGVDKELSLDKDGEPFPFTPKHYLGSYGIKTLNDIEFFYISGAFSIDMEWRKRHKKQTGIKIWWKEEELQESELFNAYNLYCSIKPNIVITHECPRQIANIIGNRYILSQFGFNPDKFTTRTSECLQRCFEIHKPKVWVFGHYHFKYDRIIDNTRFICLPELGTIKIDSEGGVSWKKKIRIKTN